jgi:ABC-2 type transport system permease protein
VNSFLPLTIANIRSFVRDRSALFWTLAFPIIFILLFGSIFSGGGNTTYPVGWVDLDGTPASAQLRSAFAQVPLLDLKDGGQDASLDAMRKGNLRGVIVIPKGFGAAVAAGAGAASGGAAPGTTSGESLPIALYTDPSQQTTSQTIQQVVFQVVGNVNIHVALGTKAPLLEVATQKLETQDLTNAAFLVPGILGMALMQLGLFGAVPLVAQREKLILKRLGATPLKRWTLVGSNVVLRLIIGIGQAILILGIGSIVFGVRVLGDYALMAALVVLGAATFVAIGYVIASFARTEESTNGIVSVVNFPMMFLSGVFFPIEIMPSVLRPVAAVMPLTYLGDGLRQVMVGGSAYAPLGVDFAILIGWLVICLGISARFFRWE